MAIANLITLTDAAADRAKELIARSEEPVLGLRIGVSTSLSRAQHEGKEIFEHDEKSRGALHYRELSAEIARRLGVIN